MSVPEEVVDRAKGKKEPPSSKLLGVGIKTWWLLMIRPIEDYLVEQKVHPNILTITTLVVSVITGIFFHLGWIFIAGILLLAGSTFDIFDGRVARAQGLNSEHGAFFDSCLDRFSEAFIYLGILSYFHNSLFFLRGLSYSLHDYDGQLYPSQGRGSRGGLRSGHHAEDRKGSIFRCALHI